MLVICPEPGLHGKVQVSPEDSWGRSAPHSCLVIPGKVPCRGGPDEFRTMQIYMLTTTRLPHDGRIFEKEAKSLVKEHAVMIIASSEDGSVEETRDVHIVTVWNPSSTLLHPMTLWRALR